MKNIHCVTYIIAAVFASATFTSIADQAQTLNCGLAEISVSPARMRGGEHVLQDFLISVSQQESSKTFPFNAENDLLQLRCETSRDGKPMLLVNHTCGGSGCADSNFSIIDLNTYEVLLTANARWKGNHAAAEVILGKKLESLSCGRSRETACYSAVYE